MRDEAEKISTLLVVAAALIDQEGRVLLQRRPPGRSMAGLWEFPGGKIDVGECPEEALVRELREELGIDVASDSLVPAAFTSAPLVAPSHLLLLLYLCRNWGGVPQPLHADALDWVRPVAMHSLAMPPADEPLVRALERLL